MNILYLNLKNEVYKKIEIVNKIEIKRVAGLNKGFK